MMGVSFWLYCELKLPALKRGGLSHAGPTGAWGSLFKTEAYHFQGAKEAAEGDGRGILAFFGKSLRVLIVGGMQTKFVQPVSQGSHADA
jgi:hypothetical protein